jgi:hypothetical protein
MANTIIQLKKSGTSGNAPSSLNIGELAINYADGKLFYKNSLGNISSIENGSSANSFSTINVNSSLIIASSNSDILNIESGNNIVIVGDGINKKITIGLSGSPSISGDLTINTNSQLHSTSYTTTSTSQIVVDNFSKLTFRSAKYEAQMTSGSNYHVIELRVLHDDSIVYMAQYGEMFTANTLGSFDAEISGSDFRLLFTPANSSTIIKLKRSAIVV